MIRSVDKTTRTAARTRWKPPAIIAAVLLGTLRIGAASDSGSLRLVGSADGVEFDQLVVEGSELRYRATDGSTRPLPDDNRWQLEGDLRAHAAKIDFAPEFWIIRGPARPLGAARAVHAFAVIKRGSGDMWESTSNSAHRIVVFAWLVDGVPTQMMAVPSDRWQGVAAGLASVAVVELTDTEVAGRPAVLLLENGEWRTRKDYFSDPIIESAFVHLHVDPSTPFAALVSGTDPTRVRTKSGKRPLLTVLAGGGFAEATRWMLEHGADPNARSASFRPAIHEAAARGYADTVDALMARGARPFAPDSDRLSAIDHAVRNGHLAVAGRMLGAKPPFDELRSVFRLALEQGDSAAIEELLELGGRKLVRSLRPEDFRACMAHGGSALIRKLLDAGLEADHADLVLAATCGGQPEVVELLRSAGANVDRPADDGTTALLVAAGRGDLATMEVLLAAGAGASHRNKQGETPIGLAVAAGHADVVTRLRAAGAREATPASKKDRPPSQRWISDALRPTSGTVYRQSEVDRPPRFKSGTLPEVPRLLRRVPLNESTLVADPVSGKLHPVVQPTGSFYTQDAVEWPQWAVVTMIVETDGTHTGATILCASSPEFEIATQRRLDDFAFAPGERDGQPVRTRIAVVIAPRP